MGRGIKRFMKYGASLSAVLALAWGKPVAFGGTPCAGESKSYKKTDDETSLILPILEDSMAKGEPPDIQAMVEDRIVKAETSRILPVLEDRIGDPDVLAKIKDKLFTLRVEEIRLVSSLCGRIAAGERTARADIVFSLVTALIVLS